MEITRTARAEQTEIKLKGRLDASWSDRVAKALAECVQSGQHAIAIDMAEVDYISSAGIRILVIHARQLKTIQGRLVVVNASTMVRKALQLAGLEDLLHVVSPPSVPVATGRTGTILLPQAGATAEVFELEPDATIRVRWHGDSKQWFSGGAQPESSTTVQFPANTMGIGLGALGEGESDGGPRFGEFLAATGAAVSLPADGSNQPDYMLQQGALTPAVRVAYGMLGSGSFRRLVRFDKGPEQTSLTFSSIINACLDACGGEAAGLVMVAETAALIGAAMQKMPSPETSSGAPADIFAFPAIRDWLSFTAEAAFTNTTSLIVGFAANEKRGPDLRLLKPLVASGQVHGHFHAAAFPYQPLRKGKVDLGDTVGPLFESGQILGLLHLLNDWRAIHGGGESRFLRGACWCAPLVF
jgi:anti-anti-sigma factor